MLHFQPFPFTSLLFVLHISLNYHTYGNKQAKGSIICTECQIFPVVSGDLRLPLRCTLGKAEKKLVSRTTGYTYLIGCSGKKVGIWQSTEGEERGERRGMWLVHIFLSSWKKTQRTVTPCRVSEGAGVYTKTKTDSQNNRSHQNTSTHIHIGRLIAPDSGSLSLPSQHVSVIMPLFCCRQTIYLSLIADLFSVMLGQMRMSLLRGWQSAVHTNRFDQRGSCASLVSGLGSFPFALLSFKRSALEVGIKNSGFISATLQP